MADLLICRAFNRRKKALLVLPFVSMVEEATLRLSALFRSVPSACSAGRKGRGGAPRKVSVEGCHGSRGGNGFDGKADVVVCTFEKSVQVLTRLHEAYAAGAVFPKSQIGAAHRVYLGATAGFLGYVACSQVGMWVLLIFSFYSGLWLMTRSGSLSKLCTHSTVARERRSTRI